MNTSIFSRRKIPHSTITRLLPIFAMIRVRSHNIQPDLTHSSAIAQARNGKYTHDDSISACKKRLIGGNYSMNEGLIPPPTKWLIIDGSSTHCLASCVLCVVSHSTHHKLNRIGLTRFLLVRRSFELSIVPLVLVHNFSLSIQLQLRHERRLISSMSFQT